MTDINETLKQRGQRYGTFAENAATAQSLKGVLRSSDSWVRLDHDMQQALDVICDKASRILSGDPTYADNWHDIAGYAKLVEDRLTAPVAPIGIAPEPEYAPGGERLLVSMWYADTMQGVDGFVVNRRHNGNTRVRQYDCDENSKIRTWRLWRDAQQRAKELNQQESNTAPLEQPALSQDDDPEWGPWAVWPVAIGEHAVRRYDENGNYQAYEEGAGYVLYRYATEARDKANELNEANKAAQASTPEWGEWAAAPTALNDAWVVMRTDAQGGVELYRKQDGIRQYPTQRVAMRAAELLNQENKA
jgi:hypothetical protein